MDIDYIRKTIPHITDDIIEKQKALQAGTCLGFGLGFRIPLIVRMEMPDPAPLSGNCDVAKIWNGTGGGIAETPAPVQSQTVEQANQVTQTVNENPVIDNSISSGSSTPEGPSLVSNEAETTASSNDAEPKFDTSFVIPDQPIINQNPASSMPSQAAPVSQMAPVGQEMVNQPIPELQASQPQEPLIKLSTEGTGM